MQFGIQNKFQTCSQDLIDNGNYDQTISITNNFNAFENMQVMVKISDNNCKIHLPYRYIVTNHKVLEYVSLKVQFKTLGMLFLQMLYWNEARISAKLLQFIF